MEYDVALSFAGEDREYVETVAHELKRLGVRVFYDNFENVDLWGKDLYTHLQNIYQKEAKYTVIFISKHYAKKLWTNHERKMAQARAFSESREYILPARFDNTEIEGITQTIGYFDLNKYSPKKFAALITEKVKNKFPKIALTKSKSKAMKKKSEVSEKRRRIFVSYCRADVEIYHSLRDQTLDDTFLKSRLHFIPHDLKDDFNEKVTDLYNSTKLYAHLGRPDHALVVLSHNFISDSWMMAELNGLFSLEQRLKRHFIIPILVGTIEDKDIHLYIKEKNIQPLNFRPLSYLEPKNLYEINSQVK